MNLYGMSIREVMGSDLSLTSPRHPLRKLERLVKSLGSQRARRTTQYTMPTDARGTPFPVVQAFVAAPVRERTVRRTHVRTMTPRVVLRPMPKANTHVNQLPRWARGKST